MRAPHLAVLMYLYVLSPRMTTGPPPPPPPPPEPGVVAPPSNITNTISGTIYTVYDDGYCDTYINARVTCEANTGWHLIHLEDAAEQSWMLQQLLDIGLPTNYWIGLEFSNLAHWIWVDGTTETPIEGSHRFSGFDPNGPLNAVSLDAADWVQSAPSNCFPFICEHNTPVPDPSVPDPSAAVCIGMRKVSGQLTDMALLTDSSTPDMHACIRECLHSPDCRAIQFHTQYDVCSMYRAGGTAVGCGVVQATLCYVTANVALQ